MRSCFWIFSLSLSIAIQSSFCIKSENKIKALQRIVETAPVISVEPDTLNRFIFASSRNYSSAILFTTTFKDHQCVICKTYEREFTAVVNDYVNFIGGDWNSQTFLKRPLFFFRADYNYIPEMFEQLEFTTIPHIVVLRPGSRALEGLSQDNFMLMAKGVAAVQIEAFIENRTGLHIPASDQPIERAFQLVTSIVFYCGLCCAALLLLWKIYVHSAWSNRWLWFALCLTVYYFVLAGSIFNAIRQPPLLDFNPWTGRIALFMSNLRGQFVVEGYIVATILTVAAGCWIFLLDIVPHVSMHVQQKYIAWTLIALLSMLHLISRIFLLKNPYYPVSISVFDIFFRMFRPLFMSN